MNGALNLFRVALQAVTLALQQAQGGGRFGLGLACRFARGGEDFGPGSRFGGGERGVLGGRLLVGQAGLGGFHGARRLAPAIEPNSRFQRAD